MKFHVVALWEHPEVICQERMRPMRLLGRLRKKKISECPRAVRLKSGEHVPPLVPGESIEVNNDLSLHSADMSSQFYVSPGEPNVWYIQESRVHARAPGGPSCIQLCIPKYHKLLGVFAAPKILFFCFLYFFFFIYWPATPPSHPCIYKLWM